MSADNLIAEILARYGENPREATWRVQSAVVIYHKALERIAAKAGIWFDRPTVLRAERDEAVIIVNGHMGAKDGDREEWSIGEALVNVNYRVSGKQAAYVYAMAEKRAKDRVILKLIGLHGLLYSEEEADDFKKGEPSDEHDGGREQYLKACRNMIAVTQDYVELVQWWKDEAQARRDFDLSQDDVNELKALVTAKAPREAA